MSKTIRITSGNISLTAALKNTECAQRIYDALPLEAQACTWGDEIYFKIPVDCAIEEPLVTVEIGDLGYWPDGSCFCIFFGPTPMSRDSEIRPASAVEVFGRIDGNAREFTEVLDGDIIIVEEA